MEVYPYIVFTQQPHTHVAQDITNVSGFLKSDGSDEEVNF